MDCLSMHHCAALFIATNIQNLNIEIDQLNAAVVLVCMAVLEVTLSWKREPVETKVVYSNAPNKKLTTTHDVLGYSLIKDAKHIVEYWRGNELRSRVTYTTDS